MYKDTEERTREFAVWIGIDAEIVKIFSSRIPLKVTKTSSTGKKHEIDGDTILYTVLNKIYDFKNKLVLEPNRYNTICSKYSELKTSTDSTSETSPSFKRFAVKDVLERYLPRVKECRIDLNELSDEEISILYKWFTI